MRGGLSLDSSAASTCRCPYCGALIHVDDEYLEYERRRRADTESKLRELDAESALRLKELRSATAEKLKASMIEHAGEWFWVLILIGICVIFVVWSIAVPNSVSDMLPIILLIVVIFVGLNLESIQSKRDNAAKAAAGYIAAPMGSSDVVGKNCEDVKSQFESAGFTNVSVVRGKSSFLGLKAGEVQSVTIDGSTAYAGHLYKPDVRVIITHKT